MIKVKDKTYLISERLVGKVFKRKKRYFVKIKDSSEIQEIDEMTYQKFGGK